MNSAILGTGSYVPNRVLTNADLERMVETSDSWIVERTGIRERRLVESGQACSDLAVEAAQRALAAANVRAEIEVYPADHGWTVIDSPSYDQSAAERAWGRMSALFQRAL